MLTRYRVQLMGDRTREATRLEGMLEDASIKLSVVASSLTTVSARAMLAALIDGERDARVLADLAKGKMRAKIPELTEALIGHFDAGHAQLVLQRHLLVNRAKTAGQGFRNPLRDSRGARRSGRSQSRRSGSAVAVLVHVDYSTCDNAAHRAKATRLNEAASCPFTPTPEKCRCSTSTATALMGAAVLGCGSGRRGLGPGVVGATRTRRRCGRGRAVGGAAGR
jgi:hypothetical protein